MTPGSNRYLQWLVAFALPGVLLAGCVSPTSQALFDGATLAGWNSVGEVNWRVIQGEIVADGGGDGFLVTTTEHEAYSLRVEFNPSAETNSGIFIHCADPVEITPTRCYEINIWDDHPRQEFRTGAIVTKVLPMKKLDSVGRWNLYEIDVSAEEISVMLNGERVAQLAKPELTRGFIAIQRAVGGSVRFRNLTISR